MKEKDFIYFIKSFMHVEMVSRRFLLYTSSALVALIMEHERYSASLAEDNKTQN